MQLLTENIKKALPPIYATEHIPEEKKEYICKFFNPMGQGVWLVAEGEELEDGDWRFFGSVDLGFRFTELGYFTLSELESVNAGLGLGIERDILFGDASLHPEWENM